MKFFKNPQFIIPLIIIIIMLGWIGYKEIGVKQPQEEQIKQEEKQSDNSENKDETKGKSVSTIDIFPTTKDTKNQEPIAVGIGTEEGFDKLKEVPPVSSEGSAEEDESQRDINTIDWNSFTHRTYGYTVKFPKNWHWDGTKIDTLVISASTISSNDEPLNVDNFKIVNADKQITETDVEIISLGEKFKAVYVKSHNYPLIVKQIITSFINDYSNLIQVATPKPNDIISSPVVIEGQARGQWFFEAEFPIKIFDANNQEVAVSYARAQQTEWMTTEFVPFKAEIQFIVPVIETGTIVLIKNNPSGKKEFDDEFRLPIKFALQKTLQVKVYFLPKQYYSTDCSITSEVIKTIPYTKAVATAAINELLKGIEGSWKAIVETSIPTGTKLLSLKIENGVAYPDFSKEFQNYGGGSCNVQAIRAQIEATLKQFPNVKKVIISVEGQTENVLQP